VEQARQLENPDARIALEESSSSSLLAEYAASLVGIQTGDYPRFAVCYWELETLANGWARYERPGNGQIDRTEALLWEDGFGQLYDLVAEKLGENGGVPSAQKQP